MPELRLTRRARERLDQLPPDLRAAVLEAFVRLRADPWVAGKPLLGRLAGRWSMRVGSYRILYSIVGPKERERATVIVRAIRHRAVAYRSGEREG